MCDELETALEAHQTLVGEADKGTLLLVKASLKTFKKQGAEMKQIAADFKRHVEESEVKLNALTADVKVIKDTMASFQADATKWQMVIQVLKALFGDSKRCVITLMYLAVILGAVHFSEIIELLKALI